MNTSSQIKQYLQQNQPASVDQISRTLDLTKADIQYHIRQLLYRGEIVAHPLKVRYSTPGRPARQYQLVDSVPIATTRSILSVLLKELMGKVPSPDHTNTIAYRIAQMILSSCPSSRDVILSPSIRLNRIISELAPLGINLSWEAGKKGPLIRINQEPFSILFQDKVMVNGILNSLIVLIKNEIA